MGDSRTQIGTSDVVAVVPARWGSQRFPGKPLASLQGRTLIAHVVAAIGRAQRVGSVLVATDDRRILEAARSAGADVVMTSAQHPTGSDRIGEAVRDRPESIVLNIQGDEPLLPPHAVDRLVELLEEQPDADLSTLACPLRGARADDPNVVKVVRALDGRALYFSRAAIPGAHPASGESPAEFLRHIGLYGFRRDALSHFLELPRSPLERAEGLEQLRLIENGFRIQVGVVEEIPPGVDTPEDLERCAAVLRGDSAPI